MEQKKQSRQKKVMTSIRQMGVGEQIHFPIEWMDTVRAQASKANILLGGKRSTHIERDERRIYVERLA